MWHRTMHLAPRNPLRSRRLSERPTSSSCWCMEHDGTPGGCWSSGVSQNLWAILEGSTELSAESQQNNCIILGSSLGIDSPKFLATKCLLFSKKYKKCFHFPGLCALDFGERLRSGLRPFNQGNLAWRRPYACWSSCSSWWCEFCIWYLLMWIFIGICHDVSVTLLKSLAFTLHDLGPTLRLLRKVSQRRRTPMQPRGQDCPLRMWALLGGFLSYTSLVSWCIVKFK